jgi:hypothetical protein
MSLVHRTTKFMTVALLSQDWAIELGRDHEERKRIEQQLRHAFREDIINGRFDNTGPLTEGSRLGLRVINPEYGAGFARGRGDREKQRGQGKTLSIVNTEGIERCALEL